MWWDPAQRRPRPGHSQATGATSWARSCLITSWEGLVPATSRGMVKEGRELAISMLDDLHLEAIQEILASCLLILSYFSKVSLLLCHLFTSAGVGAPFSE